MKTPDQLPFSFYFECKHKFGDVSVTANNYEDAHRKAKLKLIDSAWCENRCSSCNLKLKQKK